jgi:hypothetical protein
MHQFTYLFAESEELCGTMVKHPLKLTNVNNCTRCTTHLRLSNFKKSKPNLRLPQTPQIYLLP